jgi:anthranilate synthase component 2
MKILIIDNYDSFTYNLYQLVGTLTGEEPVVVRNDAMSVDEIRAQGFSHIIISPGSGNPTDRRSFGVCGEVIMKLGTTTPILGVCLGHQGIIAAFGGEVVMAPLPMHGKTSAIHHDGMGIFEGISQGFTAMRYHSLVGKVTTLPECLEVTACSMDDDQIMAVCHTEYPIVGIQFHPESVGTEHGTQIIQNFLKL